MRLLLGLCLCTALLVGTECFSFSWPHWGRCPDLSVQQNFNIKSYMGQWYLVAGYNVEMTQGMGQCGIADYIWDDNRKRVNVYNYHISDRTNRWEVITGYAVPTDASKNEGKFTVNLFLWDFWKMTAPYWVLGTDYDDYSVVYSCENFLFFFHYESIWTFSKYRNYYDRTDINSTLISHDIDPSILVMVDQTYCTLSSNFNDVF